jgi:hypothetical protein
MTQYHLVLNGSTISRFNTLAQAEAERRKVTAIFSRAQSITPDIRIATMQVPTTSRIPAFQSL